MKIFKTITITFIIFILFSQILPINAAPLTLNAIKNMVYYVGNPEGETRKLTLINGEDNTEKYPNCVPFCICRISKIASADLNNDGNKEFAVILSCSIGGATALSSHLAIVINKNGKPYNTDTVFLEYTGVSKIASFSISIKGKKIIVDIPYLKTKKIFELVNNKLIEYIPNK